jgi:hypothetical protein
VVIYEHAGSAGRRAVLWGSGSMPWFGEYDLNDCVSSWQWFDLAK